MTLTFTASLALAGTALWQALQADADLSRWAVAAAALICLIGTVMIAAAVRRAPGEQPTAGEGAADSLAEPDPGAGDEAAWAHARKMEALGLLAGGVAHDVNNLLHVIRNSLDILQRQGQPGETRRFLEMIRRSADRATALTRQLLAFSRRQPLDPRPLDPNDLVNQVTELLRHSLGERISIQTTLGPGVWRAEADAGQLETALLNLAINARDAMSQAGQLTIETANAVLEERAPHPAGQYVMIAVSDTGTGMPPEVAARACEPFFTTKEPGRGTGLGLSQVAGFARQSGGDVRISSEPGRGTTVRLYLPKAPGEIIAPKDLVSARLTPRTGTGSWNRELHRTC